MKLTFDVPEELAEKIAEDIKVALEEYKKKQEDDHYYYISDGNIEEEEFDDDEYDHRLQSIGNMFKTKEEAEFKLEQLKVLHELEQLVDDDQEWDGYNHHFTIDYLHRENKVSASYWITDQYCQFYFKSYDSAIAAINKIGEDRLKKYYFCIQEE